MHYLDRRVVPPPKCLASPRVDTFADLDKNEKAEIRERLLEMQQQRCAYCERPSSGHQDGHIEHFRDQAGQAIHGTHNMEWSNLFWSCNDESSCGKHKDQCRKQSGPQARVDPDLLIDPSTDDPHTYLGFGTDGTVAPLFGLVPPAASRAAETVRAFNLDNPFLRRMRKKAVERHVEFLKWLVAAGSETVRAYADTEIAAIGGLPFESPIRQLLGEIPLTKPYPIKSPRKLIEVALPLDAINVASAREKSIRHGHPSTLHLWWARRPLAAARAVIFAQLVNDPGFQHGGGFRYGMNKREASAERKRLFKIIEDLVLWENTSNEVVLEAARVEIRRSWREVCDLNKDHPEAAELFNPDKLPGLHDPFAGGGTIPLEAQRLGLEAFASDLNPVAVLINKAMIEIPPKFTERAPVGPLVSNAQVTATDWPRSTGLAEDVRRYGAWMRVELEKRIGHLYPKIEVTEQMALGRPDLMGLVGQKLTVIAWLWARTVKSPNPAYAHIQVPLVTNFVLACKPGKEAYVQPLIGLDGYSFEIKVGVPPVEAAEGTKAKGRGANFACIMSAATVSAEHIRAEAQAGRMGERLMAVVAEGVRGRVYLPPTAEMERVAESANPAWTPTTEFFQQALGFRVGNYGMSRWSDLFTRRQLVLLHTLSELVGEARMHVATVASVSSPFANDLALAEGGTGPRAYADAVSVYLAMGVSRFANASSTLCTWNPGASKEDIRYTFGRNAVPMTWDFAEGNPLSSSSGNFADGYEVWLSKALRLLPAHGVGFAEQASAQSQSLSSRRFVSSDPPYFDNIGYADLADFFYVWLRRSLRDVLPALFATVATPKAEELVATPARHGGKEEAEHFFLEGMTSVLGRLVQQAHPSAPVTIYYAFKQSDTDDHAGTSSTGWITFLEALHRSGMVLTGTWPMSTEKEGRTRGNASNALASSVVLVCRSRSVDAVVVSRREFLRELNNVLPEALDEMTRGAGDDRSPVAPVDLSQAIIGPGMAVFSKYASVLEADGTPMTVKTALQLINRFLAEDDFDHDTQFCLHWFDQYGWAEGPFGEADVLARAKATSVSGLVEAGVAKSGAGKLRLFRPAEYPADWDPQRDTRLPIWEALHQLVRALRSGGETAAGALLVHLKDKAESVRQLAYRLYTLCERRGWAEDARGYNDLVVAWSAVEAIAAAAPAPAKQLSMFGDKS